MKIPKRHPTFSKLLKITSRPQDKLTPNEILESVTYIYSYILAAKVLAGISSWFHWVRDDIQTFLFTEYRLANSISFIFMNMEQ